jgi:hypothetical protein
MPDGKPVLLLAHAYPPENLVGALRPFRFARYLPRFGYAPLVITATPQPSDAPPGIHHAPCSSKLLTRLVDRALFFCDYNATWLPAAVRAAERVLRTTPAVAVISTSPPVNAHFAALILKRRYGLPWIADFRDPLRGNFFRIGWPVMAADMAFERSIFGNADALIATTHATARYWEARHPAQRGKIATIYNGFDAGVALAAAPLPPRPHRVLLHAGTLYHGGYATALLRSVLRLIAAGRIGAGSIRLRMIGDCGDPAFLAGETARECLRTGILEYTPGRVPLCEARAAMTQADCLLVLDPYRRDGSLQLPAKIFEYVEIGRPILAFTTPESPSEYVLAASGIPHVCIYRQDAGAVVEGKLLEFLRLPPDPAPASAQYRQEFGACAQAAQLANLLDRVTATA